MFPKMDCGFTYLTYILPFDGKEEKIPKIEVTYLVRHNSRSRKVVDPKYTQ